MRAVTYGDLTIKRAIVSQQGLIIGFARTSAVAAVLRNYLVLYASLWTSRAPPYLDFSRFTIKYIMSIFVVKYIFCE